MKKWRWAALLVVALLLVSAVPSYAGGRGHWHGAHWHGPRVFVGFGPAWPAPWWYYPPPAYVYGPPTVVVQQPPVYVEQQAAPPAGAAPAPPQQFWYYCQSAGNYYPNVSTCNEAWVKVPARSQ
jgi:hypothetical protein